MAKRKKAAADKPHGEVDVRDVMCEKLRDLFDAALAMRNKAQQIMGLVGDPGERVMQEDFVHHMRTIAGHTETAVRACTRFVRAMYTVRESTDTLS